MLDGGCRCWSSCIHLILYSICVSVQTDAGASIRRMYQIAVSFYVVNCHPHHRCATRVGQRERRSRCRDRSTGEDSHPEVSTHQSRRVCACAYRCLHVLAIGRGREHVACHDDVVLQASHRHSSLTCSSLCSPALYSISRVCHVFVCGQAGRCGDRAVSCAGCYSGGGAPLA